LADGQKTRKQQLLFRIFGGIAPVVLTCTAERLELFVSFSTRCFSVFLLHLVPQKLAEHVNTRADEFHRRWIFKFFCRGSLSPKQQKTLVL